MLDAVLLTLEGPCSWILALTESHFNFVNVLWTISYLLHHSLRIWSQYWVFFLFDVVTLQMCGRTKLHVEMLYIESLLVYLTLAHESSKTLRPPLIKTHLWGHLFVSGIDTVGYCTQSLHKSHNVLCIRGSFTIVLTVNKATVKNCGKNNFCCAPGCSKTCKRNIEY